MPPVYRLGLVHHMLFSAAMRDPASHEATLRDLLAWPEFTALDSNCAGDDAHASREAALIRESGKTHIYNIPMLCKQPGCDPNATDAETIARTRAVALRHLARAVDSGAVLATVASGPNPSPADYARAWDGWVDFVAWLGTEAAARGLRVAIEPFDQSIGKNLLIGPSREAVRCVETVRARGVATVGLLVDMGHVPLLGERFTEAVTLAAPYLWHVHLGNCIMRHPAHPLYGDNHPPIGVPEGEHGLAELAAFLDALEQVGYFTTPDATLTFEIRPYPGESERASALRSLALLDAAWAHVQAEAEP
jgi:sugar phosphate isomerase/epimerase